jgi:riboflavin kinase/FMN adenylyltransferase
MTVLFRKTTDKIPKNIVMAIGIFDGVHLGHQEILKQVRMTAEKYSSFSLLMTFEPHPEKVLRGIETLKNITPFREKLRLLEGKVDGVLCIDFTREFSRQKPDDFVKKYIAVPLKPRAVFVGRNFTFGRNAEGKAETLVSLGKKYGFNVTIIEPIKLGGHIVSSSRIRELVLKGDVEHAGLLLGRNFYIKGIVVRGKQRKIGFPTANLRTDWELIPAKGIYAAYVKYNSEIYRSVVNIGTAPTFGENELTVEAHILDFNQDIYGREISIEFLKKIRDEIKFESVEELKKQIKKDIEKSRAIFDSASKEM